jgi:HdeA/HdeB family
MKKLLAAAAFAAFLAPQSAHAESMDLSQLKCSDLASFDDETGQFIFTWLLGYVGGNNNMTAVDPDAFGDAGTAMGEHCAANPDESLIDAAEASLK